MKSHRKSQKWSSKLNRRVPNLLVDPLESRQMLTTLNGLGMEGPWVDPNTNEVIAPARPLPPGAAMGSDWFIYRPANGDKDHAALIQVGGNIRAHFIFAAVDDTNTVTFGDAVPFDAPDDVKGADLFAIYVDYADVDAYISIVNYEKDNNALTAKPFLDNAGSIRVVNAQNGKMITVNPGAGTGKLYLGARTRQIQNVPNSDNVPILTSGPLPGALNVGGKSFAAGDTIDAGLHVAPGNSLGKFLFDGTVTGTVEIGGAMNLFYAGQLLTGDAGGLTTSDDYTSADTNGDGLLEIVPIADNFSVLGDLRDLMVKGSIGTQDGSGLHNPTYLTQFQARIEGRLGQVRALDSFTGRVNVIGDPGWVTIGTPQQEIEGAGKYVDPYTLYVPGTVYDPTDPGSYIPPTPVPSTPRDFRYGYLRDGAFNNDNFSNAQYLGSITSDELGESDLVQVRGVLAAVDADDYRDWFDYYGVALMAGQSVEVDLDDFYYKDQLAGGTTTLPADYQYPNVTRIGVFDPDGRLIWTDYSDVDRYAVAGAPFRITADRPGVYRFVVAMVGDVSFTTHDPVNASEAAVRYQLKIRNVGDIALGGVVVNNVLLDPGSGSTGFSVGNGDLGAIVGQGSVLSLYKTAYNTIINPDDPTDITYEYFDSAYVGNGSLRTVEGGEIGSIVNGFLGRGFDVDVPAGDVGLIRSTTGIVSLNDDENVSFNPNTQLTIPYYSTPIGGTYQVIQAQTTFTGNITANKGLGVLRAGDMATTAPDTIVVNADQTGEDGIIDLIDVGGDFGTLEGGGPWITTGPGGNLRYLNVGGTVFSDSLFGGGSPQNTIYSPGETAILNDDSGSIITLRPTGQGTLNVTTYGIRGSGGVAIVRVNVDSPLTVTGTSDGDAGSAEIGVLNLTAGGSLTINGTAKVDVFDITGGDFTTISNMTDGELVNIDVNSVQSLIGQSLGLATGATPAAVNSLAVRSNAFPFDQQHNGIFVAGAIGTLSSRGAIGAVSAGSIGRVIADSDSLRTEGSFDGIIGNVYSGGAITEVSIGAGVMPSGNATAPRAGIFAVGAIGTVKGDKGADIRGNVVSGNSIGTIRLNGGSIINANIMVVNPLSDSSELSLQTRPVESGPDSYTRPVYEIGNVSIEGGKSTKTTSPRTPTTRNRRRRRWLDLRKRGTTGGGSSGGSGGGTVTPAKPGTVLPGGVIGSVFYAADIGTINITGFGLFNSIIGSGPSGVVNSVQAAGYGIRGVIIGDGARVGRIVATGNGANLPVTNFSESVRQSETQTLDPFFLFPPSRLTDLHMYLTTTKDEPTKDGYTNSGVISSIQANATRDLDLLQAWRLESAPPVDENAPVVPQFVTNATPIATFNFANSIKQISIAQDILGAEITTGSMQNFTIGRDVLDTLLTVAGRINNINIGRHVNAFSKIHAIGRNGIIDNLNVNGDVAGEIIAQRRIGKYRIRGEVTGRIVSGGKQLLP